MPYNWNGDYIPSKADRFTDILGQKEIDGVGQLIYHPFRYIDYILANDREEYCAFPICKPGYEPTFLADDSASGKGLLVSLCNLAIQIDDWDSKILCIRNLLKKGLTLRDMMQNLRPVAAHFQSMIL